METVTRSHGASKELLQAVHGTVSISILAAKIEASEIEAAFDTQ